MSEDLSQLFVKIESIDYYLPKKIETIETLIKENPDWSIDEIDWSIDEVDGSIHQLMGQLMDQLMGQLMD